MSQLRRPLLTVVLLTLAVSVIPVEEVEAQHCTCCVACKQVGTIFAIFTCQATDAGEVGWCSCVDSNGQCIPFGSFCLSDVITVN